MTLLPAEQATFGLFDGRLGLRRPRARDASGALQVLALSSVPPVDLQERLLGLLDDPERARRSAVVHTGRRDARLVGQAALRLLLSEHLSVEPEGLKFTCEPCAACGGAHGRPVLEGRAAHFSLSYSTEAVLVAVADAPVGVDVEAVPEPEVVDDVLPALHEEEVRVLRELHPSERVRAFARVWTRKEAYLKALGTGLARDPSLDYVGTGLRPRSPANCRLLDVSLPGTLGVSAVAAVAIVKGGRMHPEDPHA